MVKVTLKGTIVVPAEQLEAVKDALVEHIALTRAEEGCLVFDVSQSADNPLAFDVYEEFVDDAAFSAHQARAKGTHWVEVTSDAKRDFVLSRE